jgi:type IV pilus assembly protein PilB
MLADLDLTPDDIVDKHFYRGAGCPACNNTGFKGRTGLFEFLEVTEDIRELINQGASTEQLRAACNRSGMESLRDAGLEKIFGGVSTIEEVVRETVAHTA